MQEVVGHEGALGVVDAAMRSGRMHHAWVFYGPSGVGKRTAAVAVGKVLLCHDAKRGADDEGAGGGRLEACGVCASCRLLGGGEGGVEGAHPDLHVVRKELAKVSDIATLRGRKLTSIPVDLLRERMVGGVTGSGDAAKYFEPVVSKRAAMGHGKVFIVDEAELLAPAGQNLLLKTLEEPAAGTFIILVTTQENRLLPTIRSRCQRVGFGVLSDDEVRGFVAGYEGAAEMSDAERELVVRFAAGSFGRAELAISYGLHKWLNELEGAMREMAAGKADPRLGQRLGEMAEGYAKSVADADSSNSKDAANKAAVRLMLSVLGDLARRAIRHYSARGEGMSVADVEARVEGWLDAVGAIDAAERHLEANVSAPLLLENLGVQWSRAVVG